MGSSSDISLENKVFKNSIQLIFFINLMIWFYWVERCF